MKANEIFQGMSDERCRGLFEYLRAEQREIYAAAVGTLAANRKLRPVFVQKKSVQDQITWLIKNIKMKASAEIGENVLQLWLLKGNRDLLVTFLDRLGIEHDGEGAADDIPEEIPADKLDSTITEMLKDHDPDLVRIYLQTFQLQRPNGWDTIATALEEHEELKA
ncbi:MAG: hypothetical protein AAF226_01030 [Verrucomicrobiota bacterium]